MDITPKEIFYGDDIIKKYSDFKNSLTILLETVEQRIANLDRKEQANKKMKELVALNIGKYPERIKINVGGKHFETLKSTLISLEGTYFYALLASGMWKPDSDGITKENHDLYKKGVYFIDRNPKHFSRILDFLRTEKFSWEGLKSSSVSKLLEDFDYYQIEVPPNLVVIF
jgi:hypothetical protein